MSSSVTTSAVRAEAETGSHLFTIFRYSLMKGAGIGKPIKSDVFTIGGYNWVIRFYPDGFTTKGKNFISLFLVLKDGATDVKAQYTLTILQHDGLPSDMSCRSTVQIFNSTKSYRGWGNPKFTKRSEFEASKCLKDDAFTIKCTVTVVKGTHLQETTPYGIDVPPSNLNQHFGRLLESGDGADITFLVKGGKKRFRAHRCVLAARSAVFKAELFGSMREKWEETITIDEIEEPVFESMLSFIYSDSLPDFEGNSNDNDGKNHDLRSMAQHLLAAADRYDLERLKLTCEDFLCKNLDMNTVESTLILAERYNCNQLKERCLQFMSSPEFLKTIARTNASQLSMKRFPSMLKDCFSYSLWFYFGF